MEIIAVDQLTVVMYRVKEQRASTYIDTPEKFFFKQKLNLVQFIHIIHSIMIGLNSVCSTIRVRIRPMVIG